MSRWKVRCGDEWHNDLVLVVSDDPGRALAVAGACGEGSDRESMANARQRTKAQAAQGMAGTLCVEDRFMTTHLVERRHIRMESHGG